MFDFHLIDPPDPPLFPWPPVHDGEGNPITPLPLVVSVREPTPTSVRTAAVAATPTRSGLVVRWRTTSDSGIVGFNVYGDAKRLNRHLVAASGTAAGHAYRWLVPTKARGRTYRVQALLASGRKVWLGSTKS